MRNTCTQRKPRDFCFRSDRLFIRGFLASSGRKDRFLIRIIGVITRNTRPPHKMSLTDYEAELEAFIARQRQLIEQDKQRFAELETNQEVPEEPQIEAQAPERRVEFDKLSKEMANRVISTKSTPEEPALSTPKRTRSENETNKPLLDPESELVTRSKPKESPKDSAPSVDDFSPAGSSKAQQLTPQQDAMEQWVSDTFFSYFPSFNKKQKEQKGALSRKRQEEYQEYLKNVNFIANAIPEVTTKHQEYIKKYGKGNPKGTPGEGEKTGNDKSPKTPTAGDGMGNTGTGQQPQVRFGKSLVAEGNTSFRKDTIDRRNRMLAEEESRRKMEYQRELIKQIEEKRKEVERMREKEKLEEEMLTSRLEQQLKTMQLEEQLEHERLRSEKVRIANEQNHIRRLQLLANLENDHKLFNPYDGQRKALSDNGGKPTVSNATKATLAPNAFSSGDERTKAYRYFSTSAPDEKHGYVAPSSALSSEHDYDSSSETTAIGYPPHPLDQHHYRYQYCKNCRGEVERSFLPLTPGAKSSNNRRKHTCTKCVCKRTGMMAPIPGQVPIAKDQRRCERCERSIKRSLLYNGRLATLCAVCQLATDARRTTTTTRHEYGGATVHPSFDTDDFVEDSEAVNERETNAGSPVNPYKIIDVQYHESDDERGELGILNPVIVKKNYRRPPYSMNIPETSLFHPSKSAPEPVVSVNVRNGEVFVENKLPRSRPASPPVPALKMQQQQQQQQQHSSEQHHRRDHQRDDESSEAIGDDLVDERISKYVRNYNTLWMKRGGRKQNGHVTTSHSPNRRPHQPPHTYEQQHSSKGGTPSRTALPSLSPPKVYVSDRPEKLKSDGLKLVEKKWDVPAVERTKVHTKGSTRVLTQLGTIRKQLQLEQLQMDDGQSSLADF
ncbi:uncharacterized protein LOC118467340 isoform X3 [Anopheles albimanus]|uniref:uncharacterized protein LOC118467340 isoform X3 n=1 Tax=Anopheles albimanus TaxID=7167 RepID=UPI0016421C95|nr:uncharacterized protein LOC118467340 isoform X3 [Anopheles albimanus]